MEKQFLTISVKKKDIKTQVFVLSVSNLIDIHRTPPPIMMRFMIIYIKLK